jgi:uncharacterized protein
METKESPYIDVRSSADGKGLFAAQDIPSDTVLLKIEKGKELSLAETLALKENESYCLQIGADIYIALHYPFFLANHSCNPNCGINGKLEFFTSAPVSKGEELRWDYSTSMLERSWTMKCNCGEKNCRKEISDFDQLPYPLQRAYIRRGIVMPFIIDLLGNK